MDEEVESKYVCPVCCEVLKRPLILPCRHRFCTECIIESHKHTPSCPVCRSQMNPSLFTRDITLEKEISLATITCQPCGQNFSLLHFNAHTVACSKRKQSHSLSHLPRSKHVAPNRSTFKCPFCSKTNLDCSALVEHCNRHHKDNQEHVVCPVCSSMPWGDPTQLSTHFISHLNIRHKFEYDTFVDYEQNDDQALRAAIEASLIQK